MTRGLYAAASAMMMDISRQEAISNNLANLNTTAYKRHLPVQQDFERHMLSRLNSTQAARNPIDTGVPYETRTFSEPVAMGAMGLGTQLGGLFVDHANGALKATQSPFDLALQSQGYFVVQAADGILYTRNGAFTRSAEGQLVTHEGFQVLGQNGPIELGEGDLNVGIDGTVSVNGQQIDQLQVVDFSNPQALIKRGSSFYEAPVEMSPEPVAAELAQGSLEMSNVDVSSEMAQMITALRSYQVSQKALQSHDDLLGKAINEVGRPAS